MTATTTYLLYLVFALGGAGVYFLLPRAGRSMGRAGAIFGVAGVVGLITLLATQIAGPDTSFYFYLFATIAIVAATRVVTHPKPVYSALYFVLVVVAVAALLVLQGAEFAAVALIIVYAGAILVTYLFVIMLAKQRGSAVYDHRSREPFMAVVAGFVLMAAVAGRASDLPVVEKTEAISVQDTTQTESPAAASNSMAVGTLLMTKYVVAIEIAGVLLLVSMVGAIAMSRKKVPVEGMVTKPKPLGQAGREVAPF